MGERRRETEKERRGSETDVPKLYTYNEYELSVQSMHKPSKIKMNAYLLMLHFPITVWVWLWRQGRMFRMIPLHATRLSLVDKTNFSGCLLKSDFELKDDCSEFQNRIPTYRPLKAPKIEHKRKQQSLELFIQALIGFVPI